MSSSGAQPEVAPPQRLSLLLQIFAVRQTNKVGRTKIGAGRAGSATAPPRCGWRTRRAEPSAASTRRRASGPPRSRSAHSRTTTRSPSGRRGPRATSPGRSSASTRRNRIVRKIRVGTSPASVVGPFGSIWAADPGDGVVTRIDPRTNRIVARIKVPGATWTAASQDAVWITQGAVRSLARIDPSTNKIVATLETAAAGDPAVVGDAVRVPNPRGATVAIVDTETNAVRETLKVGTGPFVVTEIDGEAWIPSWKGRDVWRVKA